MTTSESTQAKKRVFSGMQPSGEAHLGNYLGALRRWVGMQDDFDCIWCIVDQHAITSGGDPTEMPGNVLDLAISYLAVGLDPERAIIFVQSDVPEHTELAWLFNAVTPIGDLERMTQFKDKSQRFESIPAGILNYPILQAADILLYKPYGVPVGEDQKQHLELTRDIARKFNGAYGETFPETEPLIERGVGRIMGLDGKSKMSKSLGNHLGLLEEDDVIRAKLRPAYTDPARLRKSDPGNPDICNIFTMHQGFSPAPLVGEIDRECRKAGIGCFDCKMRLADSMNAVLSPVREQARELEDNPDMVHDVLGSSARFCKAVAEDTMAEVRTVMGLR